MPKKGAWTVFRFKEAWQERGGGVFERGIDTPMPTMIILSHLELARVDLQKLNSSILMEIVTISAGQVDEFYFYLHHPHKSLAFWKKYPWTSLSFSYSLKITCILLRQVVSLKKMVVLSVKFTILISWSPICIPLMLLSLLMRLAITSAAVLYDNLDSCDNWRTHIGVKRSDRRPFILILDSILTYAT